MTTAFPAHVPSEEVGLGSDPHPHRLRRDPAGRGRRCLPPPGKKRSGAPPFPPRRCRRPPRRRGRQSSGRVKGHPLDPRARASRPHRPSAPSSSGRTRSPGASPSTGSRPPDSEARWPRSSGPTPSSDHRSHAPHTRPARARAASPGSRRRERRGRPRPEGGPSRRSSARPVPPSALEGSSPGTIRRPRVAGRIQPLIRYAPGSVGFLASITNPRVRARVPGGKRTGGSRAAAAGRPCVTFPCGSATARAGEAGRGNMPGGGGGHNVLGGERTRGRGRGSPTPVDGRAVSRHERAVRGLGREGVRDGWADIDLDGARVALRGHQGQHAACRALGPSQRSNSSRIVSPDRTRPVRLPQRPAVRTKISGGRDDPVGGPGGPGHPQGSDDDARLPGHG